MKFVCPTCGSVHSAEVFANDLFARKTLAVLFDIKGKAGNYALSYLSLFKERGKGLKWAKAYNVSLNLKALIESPVIVRKGHREYPNKAEYWEKALIRMIEKPPAKLPLTNNEYLRLTAWSFADEADKQEEIARERRLMAGVRETEGRELKERLCEREGRLKSPSIPLYERGKIDSESESQVLPSPERVREIVSGLTDKMRLK